MSQETLHGRCPIDFTLSMVGGKWKPLILYRLRAGTLRFGELQRAIPQVTQRMLTLQLRELERDGLIRRTAYPEVPPRVEYTLTEPTERLMPILEALGEWMRENEADLQALRATPPATAEPADTDDAAKD